MTAAPRIAIVGAGIGGLAAAHRLQELARARQRPIEIVILEASDRAGGAVGTETFEGARLERGADTLVTHKPAAIELCRRLGLGELLLPAPAGTTEILHAGALHPVPEGFALLAPTRPAAIERTSLLSEAGKRRALAEPAVESKSSVKEDESVGSFVRRRFGDELLERIVEPIVGAIHLADVDRLSLQATFPRFAALEGEHGSVAEGFAAAAARGAAAGPAAVTLAGGLGGLVHGLVERLPPAALRANAPVEAIRRSERGFAVALAGGEVVAVDAVLLAVPAAAAALLVGELDATLAAELREIGCSSAATVHVAWPAAAVSRSTPSLGLFVPRKAGLALVAATFVHEKLRERVPEGVFLVRAFLGGAARSDIAAQTDAQLTDTAVRELSGVLGVVAHPIWTRTVRHPDALPQPAVGHPALVGRIRARVEGVTGLQLAGGPVGAYGLPDTISAAESAAERLLDKI